MDRSRWQYQTRSKSSAFAVSLALFYLFLCGFTPKVGQQVELTEQRNARQSANFLSRTKNVVFVADKGVTGRVTNVVKYAKSGNYGVQMIVTGGTDTRGRSHAGRYVWVYYQTAKKPGKKDPGSKYLAIKDYEGKVLNGAEIPDEAESVETVATGVETTSAPVEPIATPAPAVSAESLGAAHKPNVAETTEAELCGNCNGPATPSTTPTSTAQDILSATSHYRNDLERRMEAYGSSIEVERMVSYALKNINPKDKGWCYRYVKPAITFGGLTSKDLSGRSANESHHQLKKAGFINLMDDPEYRAKFRENPNLAPKGAIMVYRYVSKEGDDLGHIEIKTGATGRGGYASYKYNEVANYGSNLEGANTKLNGVYIRPDIGTLRATQPLAAN